MKKNNQAETKMDWSGISGFLLNVVLGLLIGMLLVVFVIQKSEVVGSSMEPTLSSKDIILVDKISLHFRDIQRGDIVVVDTEYLADPDLNNDIVKRTIGLPGETVRISEGGVYINDRLLVEPYLGDGVLTYSDTMEVFLKEDEYFCMGDNRFNSKDSRVLGVFPVGQIKGRAILRVFPFAKFGGL